MADPTTTRHRRTPSKPLRVRTVSLSSHTGANLITADTVTAVLSPASAELPSALPSSSVKESKRRRSSVHEKPSLVDQSLGTTSSEKYGFVVYVGSLVAWYIYLIWAFVPDVYLQRIGIEWYPNREWAILIPSWIMIAIVSVYVGYFSLNLYHTPALDDLRCLTDSYANVLPEDIKNSSGKFLHTVVKYGKDGVEEDFVPPLYDLPPSMINAAVFGEKRRRGKEI